MKESSEEYHLWQAPGKPIAIKLGFEVMDRLTLDVMRGFGAVRRRGTEVGGILLGRIETGDKVTITINDFHAVPCEYAQGPSYLLSDNDLERFREAVETYQCKGNTDNCVVGFYRSHTRDGLFLDESDLRLFREYFEESSHVALVIKPFATKPSLAGFFVPEGGVLNGTTSSGEFVFRRPNNGREGPRPVPLPLEMPRPEALPAPAASVAAAPAETPAPAVPRTAASKAPEPIIPAPPVIKEPMRALPIQAAPSAPLFAGYQPKPPAPMWRVRLALMCFGFTLITFGAVAGFQVAGGRLAPAAVASATDPYAAGLVANRSGDAINVVWDKTSPLIRSAARARLTVTEGAHSRTVDLDQPQIAAGSVLYRHVAPEIVFKLEVLLKDERSVIETATYRQ